MFFRQRAFSVDLIFWRFRGIASVVEFRGEFFRKKNEGFDNQTEFSINVKLKNVVVKNK